jgi:hypothetical protein
MGMKPRPKEPRPLDICPETGKPHVFSKDWEKGPEGAICCEDCGEMDSRVHYGDWSSQHDVHLACFAKNDPDGWVWVYGNEPYEKQIVTGDRNLVNCPDCLEWLAEHPEHL